MKITKKDKKRYVLKEKRDYLILEKIYQIEKYKLSPADKKLIRFLKTQLEDDWRQPLIKFLNGLIKKYGK